MIETAKALKAEDAKKWTQARIATALGVKRETVRDWMDEDISNGGTAKANNDARVSVPKSLIERTVTGWLSRIDKDSNEARNKRIFDLWLACWTQQEIADAIEIPRKTVDDQTASFGETVLENQTAKTHANHSSDFTPPIYNVWKQQSKSEGSSHPCSHRIPSSVGCER